MFQDIAASSRDKRELAAAAGLGWQVAILCPDRDTRPYPETAEVCILPSFEVSPRVPRLLRYLRIVANWVWHVLAVSRCRPMC